MESELEAVFRWALTCGREEGKRRVQEQARRCEGEKV